VLLLKCVLLLRLLVAATAACVQVFAELVKGLGESLVSGMVPGSSIAFAARKDNLDQPQTLSYASKSEGMFVRESLIFRWVCLSPIPAFPSVKTSHIKLDSRRLQFAVLGLQCLISMHQLGRVLSVSVSTLPATVHVSLCAANDGPNCLHVNFHDRRSACTFCRCTRQNTALSCPPPAGQQTCWVSVWYCCHVVLQV
jgi:hypothetical protein